MSTLKILAVAAALVAVSANDQDVPEKLEENHAQFYNPVDPPDSPLRLYSNYEKALIPQVALGFAMMMIIQASLIYCLIGDYMRDPNESAPPTPEQLFKLGTFSFVGMIVTGKVLTNLFTELPEVTPLTVWYGYNNICVIFDYPPSKFVMPTYWSLVSAFHLLFAIYDTKRLMRSNALSSAQKVFGYAVNLVFFFISATFATCLAIGPQTNMYAHTLPFLALIAAYPLVFINQLMQVPKDMRRQFSTPGVCCLALICWFKGSLTGIALLDKHVTAMIGQPADLLFGIAFCVAPFCCRSDNKEGYNGLVPP